MDQLTEEQRLNNHMARLGAGLLLLKEKMEAPICRPLSYSDRVTFEFEGERYAIIPASLLDSDSQAAGGDEAEKDRVDAAAIASYYPNVQGTEKMELENDIAESLSSTRRSAATAMRDKCVEKVKEMRGNWHDQYVAADSSTREALVRKEMLFAQCCAARDIIQQLESLTLDQVKPGEM